MIIPYNISDFKRNLYHSKNRRHGIAGLRPPASRRDLCPPLPKNLCRAGIIPTGSCAAARRLFQQYPKTLGAPKTGRGGKDPAASRIVFSFSGLSALLPRAVTLAHRRAPLFLAATSSRSALVHLSVTVIQTLAAEERRRPRTDARCPKRRKPFSFWAKSIILFCQKENTRAFPRCRIAV